MQVDILMGTFTKSFGAVGGYIASSPEVVATMRRHCSGSIYSQSLSPVACAQIISALKIIAGLDGTDNGACMLVLRSVSPHTRDAMRMTEKINVTCPPLPSIHPIFFF